MNANASKPGHPTQDLQPVAKRHPGVTDLDGVPLRVRPAETQALLGRNSAGKSAVQGDTEPATGTIPMGCKQIDIGRRSDAPGHGIATIYRDLPQVSALTVLGHVFPWPGFGVADLKVRSQTQPRGTSTRYLRED